MRAHRYHDRMLQRLNSTPGRAAIALLLIAAIAAAVLLLDEGADGGTASTDGTPTPGTYVAPAYYLCDDATAEENGVVSTNNPPVVGQPAPDFALCDRAGAYLTSLSTMKGKVVWLNFWATWCVPCKRELPDIQALYDEFRDDGLEVLVINYRESDGVALGFLAQLGVAMPAVIDRAGSIYDSYRLTGLPDSFWVGRDGTIATVYYGFINDKIARGRLTTAGIPAEAAE